MNKNFTPKQKRVWDYIKDYTNKNEYPPSYAEIQKYMKFKNISQVWYIIHRLKDKGYVEKEDYGIRSVTAITKT